MEPPEHEKSPHRFEPAMVTKVRGNQLDRSHPSTVAIEFLRTTPDYAPEHLSGL
jgi:hypothetical protein